MRRRKHQEQGRRSHSRRICNFSESWCPHVLREKLSFLSCMTLRTSTSRHLRLLCAADCGRQQQQNHKTGGLCHDQILHAPHVPIFSVGILFVAKVLSKIKNRRKLGEARGDASHSPSKSLSPMRAPPPWGAIQTAGPFGFRRCRAELRRNAFPVPTSPASTLFSGLRIARRTRPCAHRRGRKPPCR